ncbi:hypothetical protein KEM56_000187 [Ascosphaera pollenicola]|nr:hypothetical protein KEM56_000187 [Ascosphaera pollenicola]
MDRLPAELLSRVVEYTTPDEQAHIQQVSKTFRAVCRDNILWRTNCYEALPHGAFLSSLPARRSTATTHPDARTAVASLAAASRESRQDLNSVAYHDCQPQRSARYRAAQWDPSYEGEDVDWYREYVTRNAPINVEWLSSSRKGAPEHESPAVKGMALLKDSSSDASDKIVSPLEDGSVCVWDLNRSHSAVRRENRGKVAGISKRGLLLSDTVRRADQFVLKTPINKFVDAGDLVSIDSQNARAYIAVGDVLNEVDLETLNVISRQPFLTLIFALSQETDYPSPLSVASISELSIYDRRQPGSASSSQRGMIDRCDGSEKLNLSMVSNYTNLHQPGLLSVLHLPSPNVNSIALAGRFPSVLLYDRRNLPRVQKTSFSGASLCGLAAIPATIKFPFSLKSQAEYDRYHTLIACGDYKGRGLLEFFALPQLQHDAQHDLIPETSVSRESIYQNRHTASRAKILSVAPQGTTIVFSDADGCIKWVERDGKTEVRRIDLKEEMKSRQRQHRYPQRTVPRRQRSFPGADGAATGSMLPPDLQGLGNRADATQLINDPLDAEEDEPQGSDFAAARKVLPVGTDNVADNELLIWTGEHIGRIRFAPRRDDDSSEEDEEELSESELRRRDYVEMMRRSYQRYRSDINFMRRFRPSAG